MWLPLTGLLAVGAARAADPTTHIEEASTRVDVYADGWVTVVGPNANVSAALTEAWSVEGSWTADIISGATPHITTDAISSATPFHELRNGASVEVEAAPTTSWSMHGSYAGSVESDFVSHSAGLGGKVDALKRMLTLGADFHTRFETTGRADDSWYSEPANAQLLDLSLVWIVGRKTRAIVLASGEWDSCSPDLGCVANPYRKVAIADGLVLSERHPDTRGRASGALRLSQALGAATALHGGYRYYADTWEVSGHTADLSLARSLFADQLILRANGRFARQGAASFWGPTYGGTPEWRTGDRDLGPLSSWQAGLAIEGSRYGLGRLSRLSLSAHVDRLWLHHDDFAEDDSHDAWLAGGGLDVAF